MSPTGDISVTQSVSEPKKEPTPIVPEGDKIDFWVKVCFDCFKQAIRLVRLRARRAIIIALPRLKKEHATSLQRFYHDEPLDSKKPTYSSRRHSPEQLMLDLERQLAFAVQEFPPVKPPQPPKEYGFTIEDVWTYLREKFGDCRLPRSLAELDTWYWDHIRPEILEPMRMKNKKQLP